MLSSRRFHPGEGPSRGLLCDCENFADGSFAALLNTYLLLIGQSSEIHFFRNEEYRIYYTYCWYAAAMIIILLIVLNVYYIAFYTEV